MRISHSSSKNFRALSKAAAANSAAAEWNAKWDVVAAEAPPVIRSYFFYCIRSYLNRIFSKVNTETTSLHAKEGAIASSGDLMDYPADTSTVRAKWL